MRIYFQPPQPSCALQRIADALTKYAPEWVEVVGTQAEAELVVIYAIGRRGQVERQVDYLLSTGRKYAVVQICLRSTLAPNTKDWLEIWDGAEVIWSYYDLFRAVMDDTGSVNVDLDSRFYHAPLGVDAQRFRPNTQMDRKFFVIASSGQSRLSESVRECWLAAQAVGRDVFHVGPQVIKDNRFTSSGGVDDGMLATYYSGCEFVSALRRKEGFELPAAEGLLCGARPVAFDTPDYRWAYKSWAEYITEGTRQEVVDQLVQLFRRGARSVTTEERAEAAKWFHWPTIIGGFYERLL